MDQPRQPSEPSGPGARDAATDGAAATLERQNRELTVLSAIASTLNGSVDLPEILAAALAQASALLGLHTAWVWLLDEDRRRPYLAAAQNLPPGLERHPEAMAGRCLCLDAFRRDGLRGAVNVLTCSRLRQLRDGTNGLRYHASVPLQARGKKLGVMNVASAGWQQLSGDDLRLLHTVGEMLGTAIERARLFARSVETGATEERLRLAREIHDTLAQGLTATALQLETAEALLQAGAAPARIAEAVHRALVTTRQNIEEARRSVLDLRAAPLEGRTLPEALEGLCAASSTQGAPIRFHCVGGGRPLPGRVEAGLYRIAQEALSNVVRHAGASAGASVSLAVEPEQVTLLVEDHGCGFDPAAAPATRFGLIGMRERARLLGGELRVETAPGTGTRLEAVLPLGQPAGSDE